MNTIYMDVIELCQWLAAFAAIPIVVNFFRELYLTWEQARKHDEGESEL